MRLDQLSYHGNSRGFSLCMKVDHVDTRNLMHLCSYSIALDTNIVGNERSVTKDVWKKYRKKSQHTIKFDKWERVCAWLFPCGSPIVLGCEAFVFE